MKILYQYRWTMAYITVCMVALVIWEVARASGQ